MAIGKQRLSVPRPGARAARRAVLATEYRPRFELAQGHDPWEVAAESRSADEPLSAEEIASLGLTLRPIVY